MTTATTLVFIILAANRTMDFPARIGTTAVALSAAAETRFAANSNLLPLCQALYEDTQAGAYGADDEASESFTDDDMEVASFFLESNAQITHWYPDVNTGVGDRAGIAIGEALKTNTGLQRLEIDGCSIGDAGAVGFAEGLKTNTVLQVIA